MIPKKRSRFHWTLFLCLYTSYNNTLQVNQQRQVQCKKCRIVPCTEETKAVSLPIQQLQEQEHADVPHSSKYMRASVIKENNDLDLE